MAKFCPKCGNNLTEGDVFCDKCGERIPTSQKPAAQPVQYTQPQPQYAAAQAQPAVKPAKKGHGALIAIIIIAVVLIAGTVVALFVYPGFLKPKSENTAEPATQATSAEETTVDKTEETTEETTEEKTEKETEEESEEEPEIEFTVEDPSPEDFDWFVNTTSAPTGAQLLTDSADVSGTWKYIVQYYGSSDVSEIGTMDVEADDSSVTVSGKPYQTAVDGEYEDSNGSDFELKGTYDEGAFIASGTYGKLTMTQFYKLGSHKYAIGELINPSGEKRMWALSARKPRQFLLNNVKATRICVYYTNSGFDF